MKAAIFDAPFQMHVGFWDNPEPGPGEVVLAVEAAGICAGDFYIYTGKNPYTQYPLIGGHEVCGRVVKFGSAATRFSHGQLVVIEPFLACGKCYPCRVGKPNCCANMRIIGVHQPGGYAEFVVAPETHLHPVPTGVSALRASFAEPITIGIHACRRGEIANRDYVLILGCGPIGLAIIEIALLRGARVVAADVIESRLTMAERLGAETIFSDEHLLEKALQQTNGEGASVVVEATGNLKVMEATVDLVAAGGRIVIVGLVAKGLQVSFPGLDFTRKELSILGSRTETNCFPEALALLAGRRINYPDVASAFDLWSAPSVFAEMSQDPGKIHKGVPMRFYSFLIKETPHYGVELPGGKQVLDLTAAHGLPRTLLEFVANSPDTSRMAAELIHRRRASDHAHFLDEVELLGPISRPGKILCSGINYRSHQQENPESGVAG